MLSGVTELTVPHVSPADGYSVRLVAARVLFDGGSAVGSVPALAGLVATGALRANPLDLDALGVSAGDHVRLRSNTATLVAPVEPDGSLPRRVVAADFNVPLGDGTVADLIDRAFPVVDLRMESL
jgi:anaerobic selenocysteine-containing dehydrogenase